MGAAGGSTESREGGLQNVGKVGDAAQLKGSSDAESETGHVVKAPVGGPGPGHGKQPEAGEGRQETPCTREGGW